MKRLKNKKTITFIIIILIFVIFGPIVLLSYKKLNIAENARQQPFGQTGNWKLIFDDEFDGTSLDTTKWVPCFRWETQDGCGSTTTPQTWYLPGNVIVSNGMLKLQAQHRPISENRVTYPYTSAMITTGPSDNAGTPAKFAFTYGYMEIRAKVPKGQGLWPAFWALPTDTKDSSEIDVSEILTGAGLTTYTNNMTYHYVDIHTHSNGSSGTSWTNSVDLSPVI